MSRCRPTAMDRWALNDRCCPCKYGSLKWESFTAPTTNLENLIVVTYARRAVNSTNTGRPVCRHDSKCYTPMNRQIPTKSVLLSAQKMSHMTTSITHLRVGNFPLASHAGCLDKISPLKLWLYFFCSFKNIMENWQRA